MIDVADPGNPDRSPREATGRFVDRCALWGLAVMLASAAVLHGGLEHEVRFVLRASATSIACLAIVGAAIRGRVAVPDPFLLGPLAGYVAWTAVAASRSSYAYGSAEASIDVLVAALGFVAGSMLARTPARKMLLIAGFGLGAVVLGSIGVLQALSVDWLPARIEGRVPATFGNPNHYAGYLDLAAPFALAIALFGTRSAIRLGSLALAMLLYVNVGLSYSYGGWLATGVATLGILGTWGVRGWWIHRSPVRALGAVALVVAVGLGAAAFLGTSPRLEGSVPERVQALAELEDRSSFTSRLAIQRAALSMTSDHPWLGVGPGRFTTAVGPYRPQDVSSGAQEFLHRRLLHAMNDYLNVATQIGVPGLLAFVLFWSAVFVRRPGAALALRVATLAGLSAMLVHGLVDGNLTYVPGNAFFAFALAGVLHAPRLVTASDVSSEGVDHNE